MARGTGNKSRDHSGAGRGVVLFLCIFIRLLCLPSTAYAQMPPAGEIISSRSTAVYELGGNLHVASSNELTLAVLPVYGPSLLPDGSPASPGSVRNAFGGEWVAFPFVLHNTGNDEDSYALNVASVAPSGFVPAAVEIYLDVDADSLVDPGETPITTAGPIPMGGSANLLLAARLPLGLAGGETAHLDLCARSTSDTSLVDCGNVVRIVARDEARIALQLSADRTEVLPGDTLTFTIDFTNTGERAASDVSISDYVDYNGIGTGTVFVPGSAASTLPGIIEYFDVMTSAWVEAQPPPERVKGVRLSLGALDPAQNGALSFDAAVRSDRVWGEILNTATADYLGGDARPYSLSSNEVAVMVGRVSVVALGPLGDPAATTGDRVLVRLNGSDTAYVFWHEVLNSGNFDDTLSIALADSTLLPAGWRAEFVDSSGAPFRQPCGFTALLGEVARGGSRPVGLRLTASAGGFRLFPGTELCFDVEAASLVDGNSRDRVEDVLVKTDIPLISVKQSIRESSALVGDVLSLVITVANITTETTLDSVLLVEDLSHGLGFAGGSDEPEVDGNILRWRLGSLGPGGKREIVLRARVKAGQEWGNLVASARVYGVTEVGERTEDGPASASVRIVEGVFTRRGIVFGGAFVDADADGRWSEGELGVPNLSIYLEDGTFAVTDSLGRYTIPWVEEGTHVVRIDPSTLPDTLRPASTGYFGMGEPGEYLLTIAPSGNRRADFPLECSNIRTGEDAFAALEGAAPAVAADFGEAEPGGQVRRTVPGEYGSETPYGTRESADTVRATDAVTRQTADDGAGAPLTRDAAGSAADNGEDSSDQRSGYNVLSISSTQFAEGSSYLEEIPLSQIAALSLWMLNNQGWKIMIEGHTDSIPIANAEFPSNLELSIARARSVYQVLRMNGIPAERMDYTGLGSRNPVASNGTPEGRARNRRVEIRVVPPEGYDRGDPGIERIINEPDTTEFVLADDAGLCAEVVKPEEGRVFRERDAIDVEILSPLRSNVELYVNNVPVGIEKIGRKQIDMNNGSIEYVYYGVRLREGKNRILVVCREHGGKRHTCVRTVYLSGRVRGVIPEHESVSAPADGKTRCEVVFLVTDGEGLPVRDGIFVTVDGPPDLITGLDENPHQAGVQARTAGGRIVLGLPSSRDPRNEKIHVSHEGVRGVCLVSYESSLRNWFLLGFGEGEVGFSDLSGPGVTHRSMERYHDGLYAEGKIALYGQGEIGGGHQLTGALNTRPILEDRLLDNIEPEKQYPLYGDASDLRWSAASRGGTYLRVDHRGYNAMFGDFATDMGEAEFTGYRRTFNGFSGEVRIGRGDVKTFLTKTDQVTYQEEIPGEGTSGFYFLSNFPLTENSEKVRIEIRDRYRPERIVRVEERHRHRDYDINYRDGSILFKEPVPAVDELLNPVVIVVSYECRTSSEHNYIYGLRTSVEVTDSLHLGATAVLEEEGVESSSLLGLDLAGRLHPDISFEGEYAHSEKFLLGGGDAYRMKFLGRHGGRCVWSAYYREIDHNFFNPSFTGGKTELGSRKFGMDVDWRVASSLSVTSKGYRHMLRERDERKGYLDLVGRYRAGDLKWKIGFAGASHSDTRDGDHESTLMLAGIGFERGRTSGELEYDQILRGEEVQEYPNRLQATLSREIWRHVALALKHEYRTGSRTGTRHLTQLGVESRVNENLNLYSRYRLEGALSGERGQATIGLRNRFRAADDLTGTLAAEKVATVSGDGRDDFFSLATGWLFTPRREEYKLKLDYEIRLERERRKHLAALAGIRRMSDLWSALAKGELWFSDERTTSNRVKGSATVGVSVRPDEDGRLVVLSLVKTAYEKNSPAHPSAVDRALEISLETNYRLAERWELEGKVAARWVRNDFLSYAASASTFMYQTQIIRTIGERWDVVAAARIVHQRETATVRYGGGIEIGRMMSGGVRLGAGYDFGGHDDRDSPINDFGMNGFHVGLKLKFNEKLLGYFYGEK